MGLFPILDPQQRAAVALAEPAPNTGSHRATAGAPLLGTLSTWEGEERRQSRRRLRAGRPTAPLGPAAVSGTRRRMRRLRQQPQEGARRGCWRGGDAGVAGSRAPPITDAASGSGCSQWMRRGLRRTPARRCPRGLGGCADLAAGCPGPGERPAAAPWARCPQR